MIKYLIFLTPFFLAQVALSQAKSNKFTAGAMILYGTGKTGNESDVLSRAMSHVPISVFAGYNIKKFRVGINYEYNLIGQTAEPADFGGQNIGGKSTAPGLRLEFYDGKQAFGLIYRLSDQYTLDKPTSSGTTSAYTGKSGYGIQYYRQVRRRFGLVLDYSSGEYKSTTAISGDLKWSRIGVGLVFTNFATLK